MHRLFYTSLLALLAGCLASNLHAAKPAFTQAQAEDWAAEVIPVLEEVSGKQFAEPPVIQCVSQKVLAETLNAEFLDTLNRLNPDNPEQNELQALLQSTHYSQGMLGKYSLKENKLLLVPENFTHIMKLAEIPPEQLQPLVKLTIAHELSHRLQDQEFDLEARLNALSEPEEIQAFNAAMEGQAIVLTELVADQLKLEATIAVLNYLMPGGGFLSEKMPELESTQGSSAIYQKINYDYGSAYMRKILREGGVQATWDAMAAAPVDLNIILTARATTHNGKNYMVRLTGIEQMFDSGQWTVKQIALDKKGMRSQFNRLPQDMREQMLAGVNSSSNLIAAQQQKRFVIASLMTLNDAKYAAVVRDFMDQGMKEKMATFRRQGIQLEPIEREIELADGATVHETTLNISIPKTGENAASYFSLLQNDDVVLQLVLVGVPAPTDAQYQEIADRLFSP